ncbi:conserved hypothetical protein [Beutenbergia cavernae DSM 12333]|uniref:SseB protein N-terminal domain-containing protein n=1 Tax=Beutenbergia cavernae (strain ATCC BAA-8 / DSM 12333 / CCUG 43141 / JCM 11478 / NBRC 16432 / NCIMB 13614 / HKI 0122) TaxID=471853 RepID=C5BW37_BEUC1|nr:SseB family protein [Beutenbergia cavernae]ACQ80638.1 conserved hypothetical protein [Beutenbergia cavernae DSM 12333]
MGRELPPTSPYAADDGSCDPGLARALEAHGSRPGGAAAGVVAALAGARLLVPVVAYLDERAEPAAPGGVAGEKVASAAMVTLEGPDGRAVVPVFSSVAAVRAWRADARPIPVKTRRAALSAVTEAAGVLVLDPAGPVTVLVPRPAVWALAQGVPWVPALADDGVRRVLAQVAGSVPRVRDVEVLAGERAEVRVLLTLVPGLDRAALDDVVARVSAALAASEVVAERVDSLELRIRAS